MRRFPGNPQRGWQRTMLERRRENGLEWTMTGACRQTMDPVEDVRETPSQGPEAKTI